MHAIGLFNDEGLVIVFLRRGGHVLPPHHPEGLSMNRFVSAAAAAALLASTGFAVAQDASRVSTVDRPAAAAGVDAADGAAAYSPGSVGAMHYAVAGRPTSVADVRAQNHGLLTAADARWVAGAQPGS